MTAIFEHPWWTMILIWVTAVAVIEVVKTIRGDR